MPIKFTHGDWYVSKGVASAVVDHPVAGLIEVFNTHVSHCYLTSVIFISWFKDLFNFIF